MAGHQAQRSAPLDSGFPGLVVAGSLGTAALRQDRAGGTLGARGARHVGTVRLPPGPRHHLVPGWRHVDRMMQPAVPRWRNGRSFGFAVVDHPTPLEPQSRIDLAAFGAVITVPQLIRTDVLAAQPGPELRSQSFTIPPGEDAEEEGSHRLERRSLPIVSTGTCQRRGSESRAAASAGWTG